jgi:hypothetical protein
LGSPGKDELIMVFEYATIVFAAMFLALLILLHVLKPEFDPTWRMISEYEIGRCCA